MTIDAHERHDAYPQVRRGYVDTALGQVHYRAAGTDAPGQRPLICFHQSPSSSITYQEILPFLGAHRRAIALDTPGFGESFRPKRKPSLPDYTAWLRDAVHALGHTRFDVMGIFTGAGIAADTARELAGTPISWEDIDRAFLRMIRRKRPIHAFSPTVT